MRNMNERPPKREEGCKIRIKKSADGKTIIREISQGCNPTQIKALMESRDSDVEK